MSNEDLSGEPDRVVEAVRSGAGFTCVLRGAPASGKSTALRRIAHRAGDVRGAVGGRQPGRGGPAVRAARAAVGRPARGRGRAGAPAAALLPRLAAAGAAAGRRRPLDRPGVRAGARPHRPAGAGPSDRRRVRRLHRAPASRGAGRPAGPGTAPARPGRGARPAHQTLSVQCGHTGRGGRRTAPALRRKPVGAAGVRGVPRRQPVVRQTTAPPPAGPRPPVPGGVPPLVGGLSGPRPRWVLPGVGGHRIVRALGGTPLVVAGFPGVPGRHQFGRRPPPPRQLGPGPRSLEVVRPSWAALPERCRRWLLLLSLGPDSFPVCLWAAQRLDLELADLAPAERAGVVRAADVPRWSSPLERVAVQQSATREETALVCAALAEAVDAAEWPVEHARYLAGALTDPDRAATALAAAAVPM